jgi:putative FmdB family regulatory protein
VPTYTYRCTACSHQFDIFQKFSDDPLSECPECGSPVRKVFQPVGIVFKGSGWYVTDSRKSDADTRTTASKTDGPAKESPTTPTTETAPKAAPEPAKAAAD